MKNDTTCLRISVDKDKIQRERNQLISKQAIFSKKEKFFSLLGSEVRLKIIYLLLNNEKLCVCDISDMLEMNQSPVSQHLRKLKDAQILISKREGLMINYYISSKYKEDLLSLF
ncbi:ArsR/SmtB family transcription factor [Poseidonibacter antarcticus]|uniref:ArsR/SmtB family transcription factor n=1 Tax=Poseidonibacter antarcticus TaxID=2478538 RepID=UPI000EF43EDA|nr:metalloregulator ArsR/SmtB family transcription factor [Poseidonibacter antarcticus]